MVRVPFRSGSSLGRFLAVLLAVFALSLGWLFFDATPAVAGLPTGAIAKLVPSGNAAHEGVYGSRWDGTPANWASADTIYFYPGSTNILNVVTVSYEPLALTVTPFNTSTYSAGTAKTILLPDFPLWGGFYAAPDGNFYVVTGRGNPNEDDSLNVVAVRKYDSSWSLQGTGYLKGGANRVRVYNPFSFGSCAMWLTGTRLVVHTARLIYAIDGVYHQANMSFEVDTSSMAVTPFANGYGSYSYTAHSFNQLVSGSGTDLVVADHGDAYPRAIQLGVARGYPAGPGSFASYQVFGLPGTTGDNYTGTTLTGLQVGSGRALVTGNSVPHDHAVGGVTGSGSDLRRNVYIVSTDLATGTPVFQWITSYYPRGTTWAGQPRLVKLSDSRFGLLFGARTSTSDTLNYCLIDASGAVLAQKSWPNVSFDASSQPLGVGSRLYWAGFGQTPLGGSMDNYYLYQLDLTDPTAPRLAGPPPDTTPPTITISGVTNGTTYSSAVTPSFSASDNVKVTSLSAALNGAAFTSGTRVNSPGSYSLVVTAKDGAGNTATKTVSFTLTDSGTPDPIDIATSAYRTAILYGVDRAYFSGYTDNTFRPQNAVLRAQFAKMICGALGLTPTEGQLAPFSDLGANLPASLYPHEYIAVAYNNGITLGTGQGRFSPWLDIPRAQVITMVVRAAKNLQPGLLQTPPSGWTGTIGNFSPSHGQNLIWAEYNGLLAGLQGYGTGWDPWQKMTRGEVAQVLWNLMQK